MSKSSDENYSYLGPDDQQPEPNTLRIKNKSLREGFTLIPNYVLKMQELSRDAKILYAVLLSYAWQTTSCFPGYDRLMKDLQCGRPQIAKYIRELKESKLISVERRGQGKTSIYTIEDIEDVQKFQNETSRSFNSKSLEVSERNGEEDSVEKDPEYKNSNKSNSRLKKSFEDISDKEGVPTAYSGAVSKNRKPLAPNKDNEKSNNQIVEYNSSKSTEPESIGTVLKRFSLTSAKDQKTEKPKPREVSKQEREAIRVFFLSLMPELGDENPKASVGQAINIFAQCTFTKEIFFNKAYDARKATTGAAIKKNRTNGASFTGHKNKVPYFFKTLRDKCGLEKE